MKEFIILIIGLIFLSYGLIKGNGQFINFGLFLALIGFALDYYRGKNEKNPKNY